MGSDGELEEEVDLDKIITDQDREQAAELKVKANKAFAGESWRGWRKMGRLRGPYHRMAVPQFPSILDPPSSHTTKH